MRIDRPSLDPTGLARESRPVSRRHALRTLAAGSLGASWAGVFAARPAAQGRCMTTFGAPACNTATIPEVFAPTGWSTVALDQITFQVADYRQEAAFYAALMGWTLRTDDDTQAVMEIGDWGTVIFKQAGPGAFSAAAGGRGTPPRAMVSSFGFVIDRWNAKTVEAELRRRGLSPVADHDGKGFESFHVADPDGFDLQIGNGEGHVAARRTRAPTAPKAPAPFAPTGWKTVWLDHFSFNAVNYKASASFYQNLLGWKPTYDEGSQHELLISEVGDIIVRGGNPLDAAFNKDTAPRRGIDHISFGIDPWDTDGVRVELEKRGLRAQIDTSSKHQLQDGTWEADEIHTAAFKSYHTQTPNGYNLQISAVTHDARLTLANAVKPKPARK
jgi:catechol 2,3-dioxygenase-like lactoylglutathione lyase family enzyme